MKLSVFKKGFTMIELLIVIAVLGVLAVAVLSAINPIEQINRGKDTGSRSDVEQLLGAIDRYYVGQSYYPWGTSTGSDDAQSWQLVGSAWVDDASSQVLAKLSGGGASELKTSFTDRIVKGTSNPLYVYFSGTDGDSTYVCFNPKSSSFDTEAETRCSEGLPSDLFSQCATVCPGVGSYYICLP